MWRLLYTSAEPTRRPLIKQLNTHCFFLLALALVREPEGPGLKAQCILTGRNSALPNPASLLLATYEKRGLSNFPVTS